MQDHIRRVGHALPAHFARGWTEQRQQLGRAAADVLVRLAHWLSFGSDALAGIRAGYPSALVASFNEFKLPGNYHWPTDVPDNVDFGTVDAAATVVEGAVRLLENSG